MFTRLKYTFKKKKKNFHVGFFSDTTKAISLNFSWGRHCHSRFDDFDFVSRSQVCQKYILQIACFGFLSSVVLTLYGCFTHKKDYAQYDLCDSGVYSLEIINSFFVGQVSGLVENFNIGINSDTINVIKVKLCMIVLLI